MVVMAELKDGKAERMDTDTMDRALLTVNDVAGMLSCSTRTIYRLTDSGRMPRPVRLNSLLRWRRESIEIWISQGCPRREGRRS